MVNKAYNAVTSWTNNAKKTHLLPITQTTPAGYKYMFKFTYNPNYTCRIYVHV